MTKISVLILLACLGVGLCAAQSAETTPAQAGPLRDGTFYNGVEGTVSKDPEQDTWRFTATTDVSDPGAPAATIPAGEPVEMLPCSTLEKIIAAARPNSSINGRLWARVTRYSNRNILIDKLPSHKFANRKAPNKNLLDSRFLKQHMVNQNFLFAIYFIPMTADESAATTTPSTTIEPTADEIIPAEVLKQLDKKRIVDLQKIKEMLATEGDAVLADRIGFVGIDDSGKTFTVDSLGRNVEDPAFTLLPCEALEFTEKSLVETPAVRQRFRVSGIVTTFRGQPYMLLQRAVRTYSHGNFAR